MRDPEQGMFIDSLLLNRSEVLSEAWLLDFATKEENQYKLGEFAARYRPGHGTPKIFHSPIRGSYNVNWRMEFDDGFSTLIHIPIPHIIAFPDEKIRAEVAAMMLVRDNTTIPVPEVYHWGTSSENPTGYGPFIIMEYIEHSKSLEHVIRDTANSLSNNGSKDDMTLLKAYRQMANIMLQLATIQGSAIGYPSVHSHKVQTSSTTPSPRVPSSSHSPHQSHCPLSKVTHRHISHHLNDLVATGGLPPSVLPPSNKTYSTSHEYYQAMADLHLAHLTFQHNDAVLSPPDGCEKYVARQLFRKLARDGRLTADEDGDEDPTQLGEVFKLWCDDMRPSSVLLDDNNDVVGVIDWEMSYFAPASYHDSPPWWLLIDKPEFCDKGLSAWTRNYEQRLPLYLKAMEIEETKVQKAGNKYAYDGATSRSSLGRLAIDKKGKDGLPSIPMFKRMKQNWDNGRFFVNYISSRGFAFDPIYWKYLDKQFFGKDKKFGFTRKKSGYQGKLHLLSEKERTQMEPFVAWKMEDVEEEQVVEWDDRDAQGLLAACLSGTLGDIVIPKPRVIPWIRRSRSASPPPSRSRS